MPPEPAEIAKIALAVYVVALLGVAFALSVHYSWLAKERLLARIARRMGVAYEAREAPWLR